MTTIASKLQLRPNQTLLMLNAPHGIEDHFMHLPDGVTVVRESDEPVEAVLAFVTTPAEVASYAPQAIAHLKEDGLLWLAYPKTRGKNPVALNRDRGWDALSEAGYRGVRQIAFDETWSALRFRHEGFVGR